MWTIVENSIPLGSQAILSVKRNQVLQATDNLTTNEIGSTNLECNVP